MHTQYYCLNLLRFDICCEKVRDLQLRVLNLCDAIRKVWKKSENHADTRRLVSPSSMVLCSLVIPHVEPGSRSRVNASC